MSFSIEITPREDAKGAMVHTVVVTIDDHETVLTFWGENRRGPPDLPPGLVKLRLIKSG
jgi:hypothetical protein